MNQDQLTAVARHFLTLACGVLVGRGYINADEATAFSGLLLAVIPAYFAWRSASAAKQLEKVASNPAVVGVGVSDPALASKTLSPKVVLTDKQGNAK